MIRWIVGILMLMAGLGGISSKEYLGGGLLLLLGSLLIVSALQKRKKTPKQATKYVLRNFLKLNEKDIAAVEHMLKKAQPDSSEYGLIYALRLSKSVETIKNAKTLAGRWDTANYGAGGNGLQLSSKSPNYMVVHKFLSELYIKRFREIIQDELKHARASVENKKSLDAKLNVIEKYKTKLASILYEFTYEIPGLKDEVHTQISHLENIVSVAAPLNDNGKC